MIIFIKELASSPFNKLTLIKDLILPEFPLLLAPMEDVSDPPFRSVCKLLGADLMYTEFISSEGLIRDAKKSLQKLEIYEDERPIGIQIFGGKIESMIQAAMIAENANPELLDINYGCPVKKVVDKGAGAAILQDIPKMAKMTEEIVKRIKKPVTVKTRLGWDEKSIKIEEVALRLQDAGIQALTIHCRTRKQMYKGTANWSYIQNLKENPHIKIPIIGNGDIDSAETAAKIKKEFRPDGIMIGRAAIGNPWIFNQIKHYLKTGLHLPLPPLIEKVKIVKKHLDFSVEWKGEWVGIREMRKHYGNYFRGIPHFKSHRIQLVTLEKLSEIHQTLDNILEKFSSYD